MTRARERAARTGKGAKTPRSVGAYGSKRGTPDKQVARRRNREQDGRVRESMSDARAAEEALEKRLEREQEQPTLGETPGARYARERREREAAEAEAQRQAERLREVEETVARSRKPAPNLRWESLPGSWTAGEARRMLQQGYLLEHVMKVTGVGYRWLDDIPVDKTGRGCPKVA